MATIAAIALFAAALAALAIAMRQQAAALWQLEQEFRDAEAARKAALTPAGPPRGSAAKPVLGAMLAVRPSVLDALHFRAGAWPLLAAALLAALALLAGLRAAGPLRAAPAPTDSAVVALRATVDSLGSSLTTLRDSLHALSRASPAAGTRVPVRSNRSVAARTTLPVVPVPNAAPLPPPSIP